MSAQPPQQGEDAGRSPARPSQRVGVTGLSGYLGIRLGRALADAGHEVIDIGRGGGVELLEPDTIRAVVEAQRPDAVIHTAAANPGRPEATMDAVNRVASAALAEAVTSIGARMVHVSTDVVFDGRDAPYRDHARPCPLNEYGRTKAAAEVAVLDACPTAAVVRTSLIYGLDEIDRSTAGFVARLRRGERLGLFADVFRQPVWVEALAANLVRLAVDLTDVRGTINIAGEQVLDRATFGRRMLAHWAVEPEAWGGGIDEVSAAEGTDDVPLDLRLWLDRAVSLRLPCPGVDEVLAASPRTGRQPAPPGMG